MQNVQQTVLQQFSASPTINQLIESFNGWIDPSPLIAQLIASVLDLATAAGYGLDRIGRVVGVNRVLAVSGYGNYALSDPAFKTLITAKCLANISNGSIPSINAILMTLFPGTGDNYCTDGGNMTMTLHLAFTPTAVQYAILGLPGVIPKNSGVAMTITAPGSSSLSVAITAGATLSGAASSHTFGPNTATGSGGSGSYSFAWAILSPVNGTWVESATTGTVSTPSVSAIPNVTTATATLKCTITDTITGNTASAQVNYSFDNTTVAGAFTVTIGAGQAARGKPVSHTFAPNSASVVGGVAPFTYAWSESDDGDGTWAVLGSATATATLQGKVDLGGFSQSALQCTVTDSTGASVTSAAANYSYLNTNTS